MNGYRRTEWVLDFGDCKGCSHLVVEKATQTDPGCTSCAVLDNWKEHSDRCPRHDQYYDALRAALVKLRAENVIYDHADAFLDLCRKIVAGEHAGYADDAVRSLYDECALEDAERAIS